MDHTCIKDDGGTPGRRCEACAQEAQTYPRLTLHMDEDENWVVKKPCTCERVVYSARSYLQAVEWLHAHDARFLQTGDDDDANANPHQGGR